MEDKIGVKIPRKTEKKHKKAEKKPLKDYKKHKNSLYRCKNELKTAKTTLREVDKPCSEYGLECNFGTVKVLCRRIADEITGAKSLIIGYENNKFCSNFLGKSPQNV